MGGAAGPGPGSATSSVPALPAHTQQQHMTAAHTCNHAHTHACACTHTHRHTHSHTPTHPLTPTHTLTHSHTHTHTLPPPPPHTHTHDHTVWRTLPEMSPNGRESEQSQEAGPLVHTQGLPDIHISYWLIITAFIGHKIHMQALEHLIGRAAHPDHDQVAPPPWRGMIIIIIIIININISIRRSGIANGVA